MSKRRVTLTIDEDLMAWFEANVPDGYRSRWVEDAIRASRGSDITGLPVPVTPLPLPDEMPMPGVPTMNLLDEPAERRAPKRGRRSDVTPLPKGGK